MYICTRPIKKQLCSLLNMIMSNNSKICLLISRDKPVTVFLLHTNLCSDLQPFTPKILILTYQQQTAFENIVGQGEIARNEQFLLIPQCFLLIQKIVSPFVHIFDISLFAAELKEPKIGILDKGLTFDI